MGARRSRTPNQAGARDIARVFYPDLDSVDWIPSDDADLFRLSFTSGREPRILKMATHGIVAVWREIGAFPAMRRLWIPELLEFEHTSDDLPDLGIEFHVTRELAQPQQASRAMAELWTSDRARCPRWPGGQFAAWMKTSAPTRHASDEASKGTTGRRHLAGLAQALVSAALRCPSRAGNIR